MNAQEEIQQIKREIISEAEKTRARAVMEAQLATLPADGNIGPSRHGGVITFAIFQRRLVAHGLAVLARHVARLRELDDDPILRDLALDIERWKEDIRET